MDSPKPQTTPAVGLLEAWAGGDERALDSLMPLVYNELRRLARNYLRSERSDHTLQTTALVHEAYLRLIGQREVDWHNRQQLIGLAAQMMRRVLVTHARGRYAAKRGGAAERVTLTDALNVAVDAGSGIDVAALDEALIELAQLDPRQGRVVELRYFGGLSIEETAGVLDISPSTVKREWQLAKVWLYRAMSTRGSPRP